MLDIYLTSTKDTDITQLGAFSTVGWVTVSYEINGEHKVPDLVNGQEHGGAYCLHSRFNDIDDGSTVQVTLTVQNDEVSLPSVSGSSGATSSLLFSFADQGKLSDWQDATQLLPVGA